MARSPRSRPFRGHTDEEAGQSRWALLRLVVAARGAQFCGLVAFSAWVARWYRVHALLTVVFWGPVVQALGLLLLLLCGARPGTRTAAPNIAVPLYQTGCALALFTAGIAVVGSIILVAFHPLPPSLMRTAISIAVRARHEHFTVFRAEDIRSLAIGLVPLACFLIDQFVVGARVRFRLVYAAAPLALFLLDLIHGLVTIWSDARWVYGVFVLWCVAAALIVALVNIAFAKCMGDDKGALDNLSEESLPNV